MPSVATVDFLSELCSKKVSFFRDFIEARQEHFDDFLNELDRKTVQVFGGVRGVSARQDNFDDFPNELVSEKSRK